MEVTIYAIQDFVIMLEATRPLLFFLVLVVLAFWDALVVLGMVIPGTVSVVILGYLASGHDDISIFMIFLATIIGAILGDLVNYYVGRRYGHGLLERLPFVEHRHLHSMKVFFDTYGSPSVFFARFITFIKDLVPAFAGAAEMNFRTFFVWNTLGVLGWAVIYLAIGYGISNITDEIATIRQRILYMALVVTAIGFLVIGVNKIFQKHKIDVEEIIDENN
jgi:undecaprenyl-diphosphatase